MCGSGSDSAARKGLDWMLKNTNKPFNWKANNTSSNLYQHYYGVQAAMNRGGDVWTAYNRAFRDATLGAQASDGSFAPNGFPGPGGLVNAVNDGFGLDIEYYACTDTASLGAMIDLLGGITVKVDFSEADYINKALGEKSVNAGREKLNGSQSMIYAMDDISGEEQMGGLKRRLELVESAVKNMRRTATKEAMLPLLSLVAGSIKTNLDFSALHDMGYEILKAEEMEYRNIWIPADDSWKLDENGQFTIEDFETNKKQLYNGLYKE